MLPFGINVFHDLASPPIPLSTPRCTSYAINTELVTVSSQCLAFTSSLPRKVLLILSSIAPSPHSIELLCSTFSAFCVHGVAGTPGLLGMDPPYPTQSFLHCCSIHSLDFYIDFPIDSDHACLGFLAILFTVHKLSWCLNLSVFSEFGVSQISPIWGALGECSSCLSVPQGRRLDLECHGLLILCDLKKNVAVIIYV